MAILASFLSSAILSSILLGAQPPAAPPKPKPGDADAPAKSKSSAVDRLRFAESKDGLTFKSIEIASAPRGTAATAVRTADGAVVLVFEPVSDKARPRGRVGLALVRSDDSGKTWSKPRPLSIEGLSKREGNPVEPALVVSQGGKLNLIFATHDRRGRRRLYAARSMDGGNEFEVVRRLSLDGKDSTLLLPVIAIVKNRCLVFGAVPGNRGESYRGVWGGGRRIKRLGKLSRSAAGIPASVAPTDDGYRLYGSTPNGIVSATSKDGKTWQHESGVRLARAWSPAVVRLKDDSYLMIYRDMPDGWGRGSRDAGVKGRPAGDRAGSETGEAAPDETAWAMFDDAVFGSGRAGTPDKVAASDASEASDELAAAEGRADEEIALVEEAGENESAEDSSGEDAMDADPESAEADEESEEAGESDPGEQANDMVEPDAAFDDYEQLYNEHGVPLPDFRHRIDYRGLMEDRYAAANPATNAYDRYMSFMPSPLDAPGDKPEWPVLKNMFSSGSTGPGYAPWDPAEHPEWETTFDEAADLVGRFSEAAALPDYTPAPLFSKDANNDLLFNIMLPHLSAHRAMTKQIISDAWRAPDGKPDPQAMLDSFDTILGAADHLEDGVFLIDMLVSFAEKNLVEESARQALHHGVFSADELESALEIFQEKNRPLRDPGTWVQGELTSSLDAIQYIFGPARTDREPELNMERLKEFNASFGTDEPMLPEPTPQQLESTTAQATAAMFQDYYAEYADRVRRGYPETKPSDLNELTKPLIEENYIAKHLLPSLGRVYQIATRQEANRRATQLTYAMHLYKARTGSWPESLDDLPPRYADDVRTDPFSGADFGYRLTQDGPVLYSRSENGRDDGGVHSRRWGDGKENSEASDDYVFWPPQPRR